MGKTFDEWFFSQDQLRLARVYEHLQSIGYASLPKNSLPPWAFVCVIGEAIKRDNVQAAHANREAHDTWIGSLDEELTATNADALRKYIDRETHYALERSEFVFDADLKCFTEKSARKPLSEFAYEGMRLKVLSALTKVGISYINNPWNACFQRQLQVSD